MDLHSFLQQCVQRAAKPTTLSVAPRPPRLTARRLHHHAHLHYQGQPVLIEADQTETDTQRHARPLHHHHLGRTERADLQQMFPCNKGQLYCQQDVCLYSPVPPPPVRKSVIEDVNTILWGHCGIYSKSICDANMSLKVKRCCCGAAHCALTESQKPLAPLKQNRVDHCINGLLARLMYKGADKAVCRENKAAS